MRGWSAAACALAGLAALAGGCAKPAFTLAARERLALSPHELRRVQFYTSGEIVLRRDATLPRQAPEGRGALVVDEVMTLEEVVIAAGTPCVALRVETDFILCGFRPDSPESALWFSSRRNGEEVLPLDEKRYELTHLENSFFDAEPTFAPRYAKGFLYTWNNASWQLADARMRQVHLLYDEGGFARSKLRERPPGWRVTGPALPEPVGAEGASSAAPRGSAAPGAPGPAPRLPPP